MEEEDGNHLEKYDKEIFDDEDFYSMLLKEFIESKIEDGGEKGEG